MGEGRGRDRDEIKRRADILSRQSFQKTEQLRAPSGSVLICSCFSSEGSGMREKQEVRERELEN